MDINKRVDNYYGRMQDILQRMDNHQILDDFLMSMFIDSLYPMDLRTYLKKKPTATYAQAYALAKTREECSLEDELVIYIFIYSNNPIPSHSSTIHIIDNNQNYISKILMHPCILIMSKSTQQDLVITKHDIAIWNLTKNHQQ